MKKFGIIGIITITLAIISSCKTTEYIRAELPEYKVEEVERPTISEKSEDIIKLMRYAEIKEMQLKNFQEFYDNLRQRTINE